MLSIGTGIALPDQNALATPSGANQHGRRGGFLKSFVKGAVSCAAAACLALPLLFASSSSAAAETRSLKLYFVHTKERAEIVFKRNGRFDSRGLQQINMLLRDWRRNEPTKMDPRLFDLVWEVYRRSGAKDYIHVVSAYRSPATNGMLRSRTKGVAKNSQHTLGKAMDFYIPGVKISTLRSLAMQMQVGGVGYYPTSGSPFVHLDVGGVRAWPRMSRQELVKLFPNGNTVHLPADGKPLPGYQQALASYKKRVSSDSIQIASTAGGSRSGSDEKKRPNLFAMLFGGGDEDEDADSIAAPAPAERPTLVAPAPQPQPEPEVMVAAAEPAPSLEALPGVETIAAPVPLSRPSFRQDGGPGGLATALYSPARNAAQEALQAALPPEPRPAASLQTAESEAFADLQQYAIPVPTLLGPRGQKGDSEASIMTASVSADISEDVLVTVPLPATRPSATEPLLASVNADPEAEADLDEQQELTPAVVAALAESGAYARSTLAKPAPVPAPKAPVEVASIPPQAEQPATGTRFGDAFDVPQVAPEMTAPTKGGRTPKAAAQEAAPALTGDLVAKWAVSNNRLAEVASVKAPRLVTRTLNGEYSAAYAAGAFKPVTRAAAIDLNRFSPPPAAKR
ncbi:MAG: DUF882 domain-containing protein [Alphaproteobacteria bacterium]|nr:DUF882 domain-containing protein [Alphaproteobacteria bacterium]MBU1548377.1 DUF882 domain-containing protein [Alphaproteobacteria bacterium]MBU2335861.1 DUF882 domain-containing protein [Alphaproteobacteria bacterium]MBU2390744.1 DUF882 domain-containing protein [Alphaproteobacteria bacterium]